MRESKLSPLGLHHSIRKYILPVSQWVTQQSIGKTTSMNFLSVLVVQRANELIPRAGLLFDCNVYFFFLAVFTCCPSILYTILKLIILCESYRERDIKKSIPDNWESSSIKKENKSSQQSIFSCFFQNTTQFFTFHSRWQTRDRITRRGVCAGNNWLWNSRKHSVKRSKWILSKFRKTGKYLQVTAEKPHRPGSHASLTPWRSKE